MEKLLILPAQTSAPDGPHSFSPNFVLVGIVMALVGNEIQHCFKFNLFYIVKRFIQIQNSFKQNSNSTQKNTKQKTDPSPRIRPPTSISRSRFSETSYQLHPPVWQAWPFQFERARLQKSPLHR